MDEDIKLNKYIIYYYNNRKDEIKKFVTSASSVKEATMFLLESVHNEITVLEVEIK